MAHRAATESTLSYATVKIVSSILSMHSSENSQEKFLSMSYNRKKKNKNKNLGFFGADDLYLSYRCCEQNGE